MNEIYKSIPVTQELIDTLGVVPYSYEKIDALGANMNIIYSQRSNCKSYGLKEKMLKLYFNEGKKFFLARKREEEAKATKMTKYFSDIIPLKDALNEKFPGYDMVYVEAKSNAFNIMGMDEKGKKTKLDEMGYFSSIERGNNIRSIPFNDVGGFYYDEFMSAAKDIPDEYDNFIELFATVARGRDIPIYLTGNTVDRQNTILLSLGIDINNIQSGDIKVFKMYNKDKTRVTRTIAVEYAKSETTEKFQDIYGYGSKREAMIVNGEWVVDDYPLYTEDDLYSPKIKIRHAFCLESKFRKLYGYVLNNHKMFMSDERLYKGRVKNYTTITTGSSNFSQKIFNTRCGLTAVDNILNNLKLYFNNGFILFKNDFVGDDFNEFLNEI